MSNWSEQKLACSQELDQLSGKPVPLRLPHDEPLFAVPRDMIKTFGRDLQAARIPKKDKRGRTVDLHALRHTFGTRPPSQVMACFGGRRPEQERRSAPHRAGGDPAFAAKDCFGRVGCATHPSTLL